MRYEARDCLIDTALEVPAPGWTWCVVDAKHPDEIVIAVPMDRMTAEHISDCLND